MAFKARDAAGKILMFPLTTIAVALGITVVITDVLDHTDVLYAAIRTLDNTFGTLNADEVVIPSAMVILAVIVDALSIRRAKRLVELAVFTDQILDSSRPPRFE